MKNFIQFYNAMMACCDKSINLPKTPNNYAFNGELILPEKAQSYESNYEKLTKCSRGVIHQFFKQGGEENFFANFFQLNKNYTFDWFKEEIQNHALNLLRKKGVKAVDMPLSTNLDELTKNMSSLFEGKDYEQEFWNGIVDRMTNYVMHDLKTKQDYEEVFVKITELSKDVNALLTDEIKNYKTQEELGEQIDEHPHAEIIEKLKNENAEDKQFCEALDKANESLVYVELKTTAYTSHMAEVVSKSYNRIARKEIAEQINGDEKYKGIIKISNNTTEYIGEDTDEARLEFAKTLAKERVVIPEEQRNAIKKIVEKVRVYKLFDPDSYSLEANDIKGFTRYTEIHDRLVEAIKKGNKEEIISLQKEFADVEAKTDEVIADLKEIDKSMSMVENNACARDCFKPAKYRLDTLGTSRLNALWTLIAVCQQTGTDVNEFIDNPVQMATKLIDKQLIDESPIVSFGREHDLSDVIQSATTGGSDFNIAHVSTLGKSDSVTRAYGGIVMISGDDDTKLKLGVCEEASFSTQTNYTTRFIGDSLKNYQDKATMIKGIENMILVEQQDRNLIRLAPNAKRIDYVNLEIKEPFDGDEYVKTKTDFGSVLNRIDKVVQDFRNPDKYGKSPVKDAVFTAVKGVGATLKQIAKTDTEKAIADTFKNGSLTVKKTDLRNYQAEKSFKTLAGDRVSSEKYPEIVGELAKLKKEYEGRSFFAKIFYSSVRRQSKIIDNMFTKISSDTGLSINEVKDNVRSINSGNETTSLLDTSRLQAIVKFGEKFIESEDEETEKTNEATISEQEKAKERAEFSEDLKQSLSKTGVNGNTKNEKISEQIVGEKEKNNDGKVVE